MVHTNDIDFLPDDLTRESLLVHCYFSQALIHYSFREKTEQRLSKKKQDDQKVWELTSILWVQSPEGVII